MTKMRLVVISDTHGLHDRIDSLPDGDILVHAGDFMNSGFDLEVIASFNQWLRKQAFKQRIVCAGNHDRAFECMPEIARGLLDATYLENNGITIDGVSFWGSPYTPEFMNWSFMYPRGGAAKRYWDEIPERVDVLITHGPPHGILDQVAPGGEHLGCEELIKAVEAKKPKVHIFGHIHGGAGMFENGVTKFVNAAYLNERYKPLEPAGKIRIIDL
jgi:Icc-related predicted phosphoesterase